MVRRSALVSRYGCLGVSNGIWGKRRALSTSDWERIRLHPYLTKRMLRHSPCPRQTRCRRRSGPRTARWQRLSARCHRSIDPPNRATARSRRRVPGNARTAAARAPAEAASELRREARAGRIDAEAAEAVLGAAGHPPARRIERPAGLTRREVRCRWRRAVGASRSCGLALRPRACGSARRQPSVVEDELRTHDSVSDFPGTPAAQTTRLGWYRTCKRCPDTTADRLRAEEWVLAPMCREPVASYREIDESTSRKE